MNFYVYKNIEATRVDEASRDWFQSEKGKLKQAHGSKGQPPSRKTIERFQVLLQPGIQQRGKGLCKKDFSEYLVQGGTIIQSLLF